MAVCDQQDAGATEEEKALKEFLDDVSDPEEAASSSDEEAPQVPPQPGFESLARDAAVHVLGFCSTCATGLA